MKHYAIFTESSLAPIGDSSLT